MFYRRLKKEMFQTFLLALQKISCFLLVTCRESAKCLLSDLEKAGKYRF